MPLQSQALKTVTPPIWAGIRWRRADNTHFGGGNYTTEAEAEAEADCLRRRRRRRGSAQDKDKGGGGQQEREQRAGAAELQ